MMVFASNRPNGFGSIDLWESRRASIDAAWQEPQNLGSHVNNWYSHTTPTLSSDGLDGQRQYNPLQQRDGSSVSSE